MMRSLQARPSTYNKDEDRCGNCFRPCIEEANDDFVSKFPCFNNQFSIASGQSNTEEVLLTLKTRQPDESRSTLGLYQQTIMILLWQC